MSTKKRPPKQMTNQTSTKKRPPKKKSKRTIGRRKNVHQNLVYRSNPQMQITAAGLMLPIFCKNAPVMPENVWSIQNSVINVAPLKHAEPKNAIEAWTIKGLFPSKSAK